MKEIKPLKTRNTQKELLFEDETFAIRGAVFDVYREMGCGFLEAVYQECLSKEFHSKGIALIEQRELCLFYKGKPLSQTYRPDFICYGKIIVENNRFETWLIGQFWALSKSRD